MPDAWIRAIHTKFNRPEDDLFYSEIVDNFFNEQNLSLPKGSSWRDIKANIFKVIDGKKILFEQEDSLFQRIWEIEQLVMNREAIPCFPFIFTPNSINSILAIYPHPLQALLLRLADPGRTGWPTGYFRPEVIGKICSGDRWNKRDFNYSGVITHSWTNCIF